MATKTKNYGLNKHSPDDFYDVEARNENWDRIDEAMGDLDRHAKTKGNPHGVTAEDVGAVPTERKINGKSLEKDVTLTAEDVGAAAADRNCSYNFTNTGLNSVNIDTEFEFNYVTAISEDGHGTRPVGAWFTVVNYCATHFIRQVATTCNPVVNVGTNVATRVFERYRWQGDTQWSDWVEVITEANIGVTSVLTSAETTPSVNNQIAWQYG